MKNIIPIVFMFVFSACLFSGCKSYTIGVNTVYSFEKRYSTADKIIINGAEVKFDEDKSVWILSDVTLKNLIDTAGGKTITKIR